VIKRVCSNLVLTTVPESRGKLVPRNTVTVAISMGVHAGRTILAIAVVSRKDGTEKSNFRAAKKGGKKPNPVKQSFKPLSKKLD
jgi:hypothetical protein